MLHARTLSDLLEPPVDPVKRRAGNITHTSGEDDIRSFSVSALYERALGILHQLQTLGLRRGDKLVLALSNTERFIEVFWAAVLGGAIPVPVAAGTHDAHRHKLLRITQQLDRPFICAERAYFERIAAFANQVGATRIFDSLRARSLIAEDIADSSCLGKQQRVAPEDPALIQFSSGSTGEPKGIVLTHSNLIANIRGVAEATGINEDDVAVSWMPLTHDMGLISHLEFLAMGSRLFLIPTDVFIRRPLSWLLLASRVRATALFSPNFGYQYYLKALADRPVNNLDLSAVRIIFNGAEPISAPLCEEFLTTLAPAGLSRQAMYPVYGLAEASVAVSFPSVGAPLQTIALDRHSLSVGRAARFVSLADKNAIELVSVGRAIPYCTLRITDDDDTPLPEDRMGHVQIHGENVMQSYYEQPRATAEALTADGWLRTGDLGLIHRGDLYICGRAKDIIIINGQNYHPHDLESIASLAPELERGTVVAAAARPHDSPAEQLVMFVLHRGAMKNFPPVEAQVMRLMSEHAGLDVHAVVPVTRIPKTTSGKIQRYLLAQRYADGEFDAALEELGELRGRPGLASASLTEIETRLKGLCEAALEVMHVSVSDNLFELGATSLHLIRLHEQIDQDYPGCLDLSELHAHPTVAALARHLHETTAPAFARTGS
jgi:acyl-CoA synthetase (AMP-forming)/AMP-acid ligase II